MVAEILNDAEFYDRYEIIGGEKFMSPSANLDHSGIIMRLGMIIGTHLSKSCPIRRATKTSASRRTLTKRKASANTGSSTRGQKASPCISCAIKNPPLD